MRVKDAMVFGAGAATIVALSFFSGSSSASRAEEGHAEGCPCRNCVRRRSATPVTRKTALPKDSEVHDYQPFCSCESCSETRDEFPAATLPEALRVLAVLSSYKAEEREAARLLKNAEYWASRQWASDEDRELLLRAQKRLDDANARVWEAKREILRIKGIDRRSGDAIGKVGAPPQHELQEEFQEFLGRLHPTDYPCFAPGCSMTPKRIPSEPGRFVWKESQPMIRGAEREGEPGRRRRR